MTDPQATRSQLTSHGGDARVLELNRCVIVVLSGNTRGKEHIIDKDLWRIGKRLGLHVGALDAELDNVACGCFRRRRATTPPTSVNGTRPRLTKTDQGA